MVASKLRCVFERIFFTIFVEGVCFFMHAWFPIDTFYLYQTLVVALYCENVSVAFQKTSRVRQTGILELV